MDFHTLLVKTFREYQPPIRLTPVNDLLLVNTVPRAEATRGHYTPGISNAY
jgi:hypothetical protein